MHPKLHVLPCSKRKFNMLCGAGPLTVMLPWRGSPCSPPIFLLQHPSGPWLVEHGRTECSRSLPRFYTGWVPHCHDVDGGWAIGTSTNGGLIFLKIQILVLSNAFYNHHVFIDLYHVFI